MGPSVGGLLVGFFLLSIVFSVIERLFPSIPAQRRFREGFRTDLAYWFFTPLVSKPLTRLALIIAIVVLAALQGVPLDKGSIQTFVAQRSSPVAAYPIWVQVLAVLFLGDLFAYWGHRLFHREKLWSFHAVHHGSTHLDWLSSVRLHPLNEVGMRLLQVIPLFLLGFDGRVVAAYAPFISFYAILLHANVPWTFGPLRHVIASPAFHRWHHTSQEEGLDRNFAGLFPIFDVIFGTFYMPEGKQPLEFGVKGEPVPGGILAQLWYPFRSR